MLSVETGCTRSGDSQETIAADFGRLVLPAMKFLCHVVKLAEVAFAATCHKGEILGRDCFMAYLYPRMQPTPNHACLPAAISKHEGEGVGE